MTPDGALEPDLTVLHPAGCALEPRPHDHIIRLVAKRTWRSPGSAAGILIEALERGGEGDRGLAGRIRARYGIPPADRSDDATATDAAKR